jgi:hypothetical protein
LAGGLNKLKSPEKQLEIEKRRTAMFESIPEGINLSRLVYPLDVKGKLSQVMLVGVKR